MVSSGALLSIGRGACFRRPRARLRAGSDTKPEGWCHYTTDTARGGLQLSCPEDCIPHVPVSRHRIWLPHHLYDCTNKMVLSTISPLQALPWDEPCRMTVGRNVANAPE